MLNHTALMLKHHWIMKFVVCCKYHSNKQGKCKRLLCKNISEIMAKFHDKKSSIGYIVHMVTDVWKIRIVI